MYYCKVNGEDISNYIISYVWSGDLDQAGRRLEITAAINPKDSLFKSPEINLGDTVEFYSVENGQQYNLFSGIVFLRRRNSESYTIQYTAYDKLIYVAKSKLTLKFDSITNHRG